MSGTMNKNLMPLMDRVLMPIVDSHDENRILKTAVYNLTRALRLSDQYISALQGDISEDEYMDIAMTYKRQPRELPDYEIAAEAKFLLETADLEMDSAEIADILNLNTLAVERALTEYSAGETGYGN